MAQLPDHNLEELDGVYTRPTLDLYLLNKYWKFLTSGDRSSREEIADLENARNTLQHYEKIYSLMEYGSDLSGILTVLDTRVGSNQASMPMTIYRQVHNCDILVIGSEVVIFRNLMNYQSFIVRHFYHLFALS